MTDSHFQGELPFDDAAAQAHPAGERVRPAMQTRLERASAAAALAAVAPEPPRTWQTWRDWEADALRLVQRFDGLYRLHRFEYEQPLALQERVPERLRRAYRAPVAYTEWGRPDAPTVVCCGGVANTAMRFSFLAAELSRTHRVVCMDWLGRGLSGWLADGSEYTQATYVEQLRQMIVHLGGAPVTVLGSSMGGTVAIELAARHPEMVQRLILNDVGPYIPQARRTRRAETLARHYVFRTPQEAMRRVGAAQKNDGPMGEDIRLFITYHQTRWSPEDGGRVYRLDPRALEAYREQAAHSVEQWQHWIRLHCPVLLLHGMESDALSTETIDRMRRVQPMTVAHIPDTGHTPVLADRHQTWWIRAWLSRRHPAPVEFSIPHARPRVDWHRPPARAARWHSVGQEPAWLDPDRRLAQWAPSGLDQGV